MLSRDGADADADVHAGDSAVDAQEHAPVSLGRVVSVGQRRFRVYDTMADYPHWKFLSFQSGGYKSGDKIAAVYKDLAKHLGREVTAHRCACLRLADECRRCCFLRDAVSIPIGGGSVVVWISHADVQCR